MFKRTLIVIFIKLLTEYNSYITFKIRTINLSFFMEQKPGWTYRFIPSLNMQIAINDTTGIMYTEDKVKYSLEEQHLLQSIDYAIPLQVHLVKKTFEGTIISIN